MSQGADGQWKIEHTITEHGVFFISIYICEQEQGNEKRPQPTNCNLANVAKLPATQLVPATGLDNGVHELPSSAFTVCPQNTLANDYTDRHVLKGQQLHHCRSPVGFYSPKGAGHVAEKCLTRFQCSIVGMCWPVATPGYWVDAENPSHMGECVIKGACPGSDQFVKTDQCPSPLHGNSSEHRAIVDTSKLDFCTAANPVGCPPFNLVQGCFMKPGDNGIEQRNMHNNCSGGDRAWGRRCCARWACI